MLYQYLKTQKLQLKRQILKLVCVTFNFKIKLSMSHGQITLTNKNHFPTHIWQSYTDEQHMGNLQSPWTCRSAVFAQMCSKSCGNCLAITAGPGGRAKKCYALLKTGQWDWRGDKWESRSITLLLQNSQLLEIGHVAIFCNYLYFFSV